MDVNAIMEAVTKMFPSANIAEAVQKAQEILKKTPNTMDGVRNAAASVGIDSKAVERLYNKYGANAKARILCQMLGTTPEALKDDALTIVSNNAKSVPIAGGEEKQKKFPRLK